MANQNRTLFFTLVGWLLFLLLAFFLNSCSQSTEEHIRASADALEFSRTVGRKVATGGFSLTKDSLVMQGVN